jgi:hypothetical protein
MQADVQSSASALARSRFFYATNSQCFCAKSRSGPRERQMQHSRGSTQYLCPLCDVDDLLVVAPPALAISSIKRPVAFRRDRLERSLLCTDR